MELYVSDEEARNYVEHAAERQAAETSSWLYSSETRILSRCNDIASPVVSKSPAKSTIIESEPDASSHALIGKEKHDDLNF